VRYQTRPDKSWSLTDCSSFLIMESEGIEAALTYDRHFEQAGFQALLR
jgi:predicted nucleic acid-binding protein